VGEQGTANARDHAVVIGGGIAGLLAARVLADHFAQVTLIERDRYPATPEPRKGVPQGHHVHALLARGEGILSQLFSGIMPALVADGAIAADMGQHFHWHHLGVWKARFPSGIAISFFTRPFLEGRIAERVRALERIRVMEGTVQHFLHRTDHRRVVGVAVRSEPGDTEPVHADLVVDATGRASQTPRWLEALRYGKPAESIVRVNVSYASRLYRAPPGRRDWHALHVTPSPPAKRQGVIFAVEGERLLVTLVGLHGERPPTDEAGYLAYARSLAIPEIHQTIADAEPLTPIATYRFPHYLRRHYDRMTTFPDGLLVMGDAVCSFNPLYGQGMTVSALEAELLGRLLRTHRRDDLVGLSQRFHRKMAATVDTAWQLATTEDFRHPEASGRRQPGAALLHWYTGRLHVGCADDHVLALAFFRVMHMLDGPAALFRPGVMWRVLRKRAPP
jgi:flavin-dependent dehydrogenase